MDIAGYLKSWSAPADSKLCFRLTKTKRFNGYRRQTVYPRYAPESHQYINLLMKYYRLISLLFFLDKEIHLQGYIVKSFVVVEMQAYRISVKKIIYYISKVVVEIFQ